MLAVLGFAGFLALGENAKGSHRAQDLSACNFGAIACGACFSGVIDRLPIVQRAHIGLR